MTMILTVNGPESIWLMADRRLSYANTGALVTDDARKIMILETTDGVAVLGYAGLGRTAAGTEPADWMSACLRGRNLPLEQSLGVLADAMKSHLPRHLNPIPGVAGDPAHHLIATAFLGDVAKLFTINVDFGPHKGSYQFRYLRRVVGDPTSAKPRAPRFCLGGSGGLYLNRKKDWARSLLRVVRAYDRGQASSDAVADHLAKLNHQVHSEIPDKSVGPRCIIAWRNRKNGIHKGGGGHAFFTGTARDANTPHLPHVCVGLDAGAILPILLKTSMARFEAMRKGHPVDDVELETKKLNEKVARLPHSPDETLR